MVYDPTVSDATACLLDLLNNQLPMPGYQLCYSIIGEKRTQVQLTIDPIHLGCESLSAATIASGVPIGCQVLVIPTYQRE